MAEQYKITKLDRRFFWKILIPVLAENIINALFGIMDTAMLGRVDNAAQAIAAVGVTGACVNFFVCVFTAFCVGLTVKISQSYGAEDYSGCHRITSQLLPVMTLIGVIASTLMLIAVPYIIKFLGARPEIAQDAQTYLRIVCYGFFPQTVMIIATAAFRGIGQTRIPMLFNLSAGAINVMLNYVLINGKLGFPALRVAGAAWATSISKAVACIAVLIFLFFVETPIRQRIKDFFGCGRDMIKPCVKLGISSGLEQVILQGGAVITTAILTVIETTPYAAYQVSVSIESIIWAISGAFGVASTSLAGMAMGENNRPKVRAIVNFVWKAALITALGICLVYFFLGKQVALLYTDETDVAVLAGTLLKICCPMIFGIFTHQSLSGGMRGMGKPLYPLIASLLSLWIWRVLGCFVAVRLLGLSIEWVVVMINCDQLMRGGVNLFFYKRLQRKHFI